MNAPLHYSARPRVDLDGAAADELVRDLMRLDVRADTLGLRRLRLELAALGPRAGADNETLLWLDGQRLRLGSELRVAIGPVEAGRIVFEGRVSRIEAQFCEGELPVAVCEAEDALWPLRMTRRFKTWKQMGLADIAQQLASEHGLSAQVDADSPTWDVVQQWNETDLACLRQLAARVGAELWITGTTLHLATRAQRGGAPLTLVQGGELIALAIDCDLAAQRSEVVASGYDAQAEQAISESAGSGDLGGLAAGGTSGPQALEQAFQAFKTQRPLDVPLQAAEATARARAELKRRAQRFVRARGLTTGSADMDVGTPLRLERVGALFEGDGYVVSELHHQFDMQHGLRTAFVAERGCISKSD